jgi:uncharacterized membrane protein
MADVNLVEKGETPRVAARNVEEIARLEREAARERSLADRAGDVVAGFAGTLGFVLAHAVLITGWVAVNTETVPGVPAFDPYPFGLLGGMFSLEGVLLAAFVLIKQNRMSARADERSHLDLQISLLAEQEASKIIQMLERMCRTQGIEHEVVDVDAREMAETTAVGRLAQHVHDKLPRER